MKKSIQLLAVAISSVAIFSLQSCKKDPVNTSPSYDAVANWQLNAMVETIQDATTGELVDSNSEIYSPGELSMHIKSNSILDLYEGDTIIESYPYTANYTKKYIVIHGMDWGNDTFNILKLNETNLELSNSYVDIDYNEKVTTLLKMTKK